MHKQYKRIAFVKTAWSDLYDGEEVTGKFGYLKSGGQGQEKFNFRLGPRGRYWAAVPPIGATYTAPKPAQKNDWLLIFISAHEGDGPLEVVGWYEDATFEKKWISRPEYRSNPHFERNNRGKQYQCCVSAPRTHLIPVGQRPTISIGDRMRRSPIVYVRGNNGAEPWRKRLAKRGEALVNRLGSSSKPGKKASSHQPSNGQPWYATKEHKDAVDRAAIKYVKRQLRTKYYIQDRQRDRCGYDLLATSKVSSDQLHVEVKGTSMGRPGFFMTPKELKARGSSKWRLAVVTNALTTPAYNLFTKLQVDQRFEIKPCSYVGISKRNAN